MTAQTTHPEFSDSLSFEALTPKTWPLFEALFGQKGACGNCWCMYYRLPPKSFKEGKINDGNKNQMKQLVWDNKPAGILAIFQGKAIAWAALAPREDFLKLENSKVHKKIDDKKVWSIPCTFIHKDFRKKGLSVLFLHGIIQYARKNGIAILEAYPTIPTQEKLPDAFAWVGLYKSFEKAGFIIVDHQSKNRPMVRFLIHS
ncbi:MAG: GNAT family N-acetyltransferase [Bacteroidetes bacterium]|nr:GNAT family N-acetyltransferase [Bacteroidota bacterium]